VPTYRIVRSGIALVPEDSGIFATVSVEEHLAMALGARTSAIMPAIANAIFAATGKRLRKSCRSTPRC
jgi:ABC-type branched-subunit amino acid transport system ATPase component